LPAGQPSIVQRSASARDKCFIGRTVRDHLDYAVGDIAIVA